MGPEALQSFINPEEVIKRLAAASGIDVLNLVRSMQEIQQEGMQQQQMQQQQSLELEGAKQASKFAGVEQKQQEVMMNAQQPPQ